MASYILNCIAMQELLCILFFAQLFEEELMVLCRDSQCVPLLLLRWSEMVLCCEQPCCEIFRQSWRWVQYFDFSFDWCQWRVFWTCQCLLTVEWRYFDLNRWFREVLIPLIR